MFLINKFRWSTLFLLSLFNFFPLAASLQSEFEGALKRKCQTGTGEESSKRFCVQNGCQNCSNQEQLPDQILSPYFSALPVEIIEHIASYLKPKDFFNFYRAFPEFVEEKISRYGAASTPKAAIYNYLKQLLFIKNLGNGKYFCDIEDAALINRFELAITRAPQVSKLFLNDCRLGDNLLASVPSFSNVTSLSVYKGQISNQALEKLCASMPLLKEIRLQLCSAYYQNEPIAWPSSVPLNDTLHTLEIVGWNLDGFFDKASLCNGPIFKSLKKLTLRAVFALNSNELEMILAKFPVLKSLILDSCDISDLPSNLQKQQELQYLDLSGNDGLNPETLRYIPSCVNKLDLNCTNAASVDPRKWSHLVNLTLVDISLSHSNGFLPLYEHIIGFPNLKFIHFSSQSGKFFSKQQMKIFFEIAKAIKMKKFSKSAIKPFSKEEEEIFFEIAKAAENSKIKTYCIGY